MRSSQRGGLPPAPSAAPLTASATGTAQSSPEQGWSHFEHDADFGVIGRGATVEQAFENAARATFAICAGDATGVQAVEAGTEVVEVDFIEPDFELALVTWLNALISEAGARSLRLSEFQLARDGAHWVGSARGRGWRQADERGTEVKGATLTMLAVHPYASGWEARCVVDV